MKMLAWGLAAVLSLVSLCGCETVKGVGRDIENVGSSVQHTMSKR